MFVSDRDHIFHQAGVADSKKIFVVSVFKFIVHFSDHAETGVIGLRFAFDVHAKRIGMSKEGAQGFIQFFINRNKTKKILDIDLDVIPLRKKLEIIGDVLVRI